MVKQQSFRTLSRGETLPMCMIHSRSGSNSAANRYEKSKKREGGYEDSDSDDDEDDEYDGDGEGGFFKEGSVVFNEHID